MVKLKDVPEKFVRLDQQILELRELIENNAYADEIGRAAARVHLDFIARIHRYANQLDTILGFELFGSGLTLEENLPRANTALRMLSELNVILLGQIDGLLNCFGGPTVIGIQMLQDWAQSDPFRQEILRESLASAVARANHSRGSK